MGTITNATCDALRKDLDKALADVMKKHGLTFEVGPMRYNAKLLRFSVDCNLIPDGVNAEDEAAVRKARFEQYAPILGGKKEWFGQHIILQRTEYIIYDVKPKARKNTFVIRSVSNEAEYVTDCMSIYDGLKLYADRKGA